MTSSASTQYGHAKPHRNRAHIPRLLATYYLRSQSCQNPSGSSKATQHTRTPKNLTQPLLRRYIMALSRKTLLTQTLKRFVPAFALWLGRCFLIGWSLTAITRGMGIFPHAEVILACFIIPATLIRIDAA